MRPIIEAIDGIRAIRGESNLSPALKIQAHAQSASAQTRASLEHWRSYLMPLAGLSTLYVEEPGTKPPQAAAEIRGDIEVYVPLAGLVDLAEERERLKKEITRSEQEVGGISRKLENKAFVERAPEDVVERDRARVAELQTRIDKLHENLKRIAPVEVRIAPPSAGNVNLEEELKEELSGVSVPAPDQQVKEALDKLREGTKEGLSSRDYYDLGVAYINMGLVDDAVREFNAAKKGPGSRAGNAKPKAGAKKKAAAAKPKTKAVKTAKKPAPTKKKNVAAKKAAPKARPAKAAKKPAKKAKR